MLRLKEDLRGFRKISWKAAGLARRELRLPRVWHRILVALSGLGIDGSKDARFLKNGKSPLYGLFQYYLPEGGFMHVAANAGNNGGGIGGMLDGMATEQGFYATVAYQRLLDGRSFIYDMHDIELTPGKKVETSQNGGTDETKKQEETEKKNNNKNIF